MTTVSVEALNLLSSLQQAVLQNWILLSAIVFLAYAAYLYYLEKSSGIPNYHVTPFIGRIRSSIEFFRRKDDSHELLAEITRKLGPVWAVQGIIGPKTLIVNDPACLEHFLKTNFENYVKGPQFVQNMTELLGTGIFNANGPTWKKQRQVASHLFKVKELKNMVPVFLDHGAQVLNILANGKDKPIDVQELFMKFTLQSIGEIAFGKNFDCLHTEHPFSNAFNTAQVSTSERFINPFIRVSFELLTMDAERVQLFGPFRSLLKTEKDLRSSVDVLDHFAYRIIEEKKRDPSLEQHLDLLARYMTLTDEENKPFSDKYLRDIVLNFMLAGRDTTASTLTWTFYALSQNPRVEAKLIEEIDTKLQGKLPDYESIKELKYTRAVIDEALRIYPPVPWDPKYALNDDVFPNGMKVRKGDIVSWSAYTLGRREELWDNPLEFRPERWFGENGGKPIQPYQFIPFQAGPRTCLGMQMAYLEVTILLCMILQKFRLQLVPGHQPKYLCTTFTFDVLTDEPLISFI